MKEYQNKKPTLVVGGVCAGLLRRVHGWRNRVGSGLNVKNGEKCVSRFVGTGMHGGVIYTRGDIFKLSEGCKIAKAGKRDMRIIEGLVNEFSGYFGTKTAEVMAKPFYKITPMSKGPMKNCTRISLSEETTLPFVSGSRAVRLPEQNG